MSILLHNPITNSRCTVVYDQTLKSIWTTDEPEQTYSKRRWLARVNSLLLFVTMLHRRLTVYTQIACTPVCIARRVYTNRYLRERMRVHAAAQTHVVKREREKCLTNATNADDKSTLRNREVDLYRARRVPLTRGLFFFSVSSLFHTFSILFFFFFFWSFHLLSL